jgi:NAD+ diphosphatase
LARHHGAGPDGFSLIAGFVVEEAGVVGAVTYRGSQAWPFPAGLMVGFGARRWTTPSPWSRV